MSFIDRLVAEKTDLADKVEKLEYFIENKLSTVESEFHRELLKAQLSAMKMYHMILGMRHKDLTEKGNG